ncbi:MAG: LPS assembly lipoprotein LptE [Sterolibacterium sp.]|nr:LPS assembly lipoprotein LptE [Sterolibacterium sp.]
MRTPLSWTTLYCALLPVLLSVILSACGFQLRGTYPLPFDKLYIALPETSELHAQLKRSIAAGSNVRIVDTQKEAQATLIIISDAQAKNILSLSATGRAREFELVRTFMFRLIDSKGGGWLPQSRIVLRRSITFSDDLVLSKEAEETLLWRDIQNDLVQQILRRLAAAKAPAAE